MSDDKTWHANVHPILRQPRRPARHGQTRVACNYQILNVRTENSSDKGRDFAFECTPSLDWVFYEEMLRNLRTRGMQRLPVDCDSATRGREPQCFLTRAWCIPPHNCIILNQILGFLHSPYLVTRYSYLGFTHCYIYLPYISYYVNNVKLVVWTL